MSTRPSDPKQQIFDECQQQQHSCLYTSTTLFLWLKSMDRWRLFYVVSPIIAGGIATWTLIANDPGFRWLTGTCALFASVLPAIYKALDFDVNLDAISKAANEFVSLRDKFRQIRRIHTNDDIHQLQERLAELVAKMDKVRMSSPVAPERFFRAAQKKIKSGDFDVDTDATRM